MQERRRFVRVATALNIVYTKHHTSEKEKLSFSKDINKTGLCLTVYEKLKKLDSLDLKIQLTKDEALISVTGRVVWIHRFATDPVSKEKRFYAGIEFTKIDEQSGKRIEEYVSSVM